MGRNLKLRDLRRHLSRLGVTENTKRGKGSHILFSREIDGKKFTYPMPTDKNVKSAYLRPLRKQLRLLPEDGVPDSDFFGEPKSNMDRVLDEFPGAKIEKLGSIWEVNDGEEPKTTLAKAKSKSQAWSDAFKSISNG